jgi:CBS domain-containing protein
MKRHTVDQVMTRNVATVRPSTGYKEILETMSERGISAIPVVDAAARVVGVVSEADLLHKVEFAGNEPQSHLLERKRVRQARHKAGADTAADLMTSPAVVIGAHESVAAAAKLMAAERVKRLPVVDGDGCLVGVVSRSDVLRPYLRTDEEVRQEVIDDVLLKTLWIDPTDLTVEVRDGVVTLGGTIERRSSVPVVVQLVAAVPGAVDVVNQLDYAYDDTGRHPDVGLPIVA